MDALKSMPSIMLATVNMPPIIAQTFVKKLAKDGRDSVYTTSIGEKFMLKKTPKSQRLSNRRQVQLWLLVYLEDRLQTARVSYGRYVLLNIGMCEQNCRLGN